MAGVTAYVLTFALDTTAYLNDEYGSVIAGRGMAREPGEIVSAAGAGLFRGPERLTSVLLAVPDALLGSTPDEMKAGHVCCLAYALTAVPAYALLRGLDVPRWPSVGLAVAAILGPWAVFGTTMLNVTLAAPLTVVFVWAAWRAVVAPTLGAEALAVLAAALMTTARASHAVFFGAAVLAAVLAAWWARPAAATPLDAGSPALALRRATRSSSGRAARARGGGDRRAEHARRPGVRRRRRGSSSRSARSGTRSRGTPRC